MNFNRILLLFTALLLTTCVREVDFQANGADRTLLVVNGALTNLPGPQTLKLTRPGNYAKQVFESVFGAEVALFDEFGNRFDYHEVVAPDGLSSRYELDFQGQPGQAYRLEIRLASGELYRTQPQVMPEPVLIDSLVIRPELQQLVTPAGVTIEDAYAVAYAYSQVPAAGSDKFVRWDGEGVYIFNELPKIWDPFGVQKQCFITNRISDQTVPLADLQTYAPGALLFEAAGKRRIDYAFEHRFCFVVYQRTIDRAAYEYWSKINQLLAANGTIFDAPPASVAGNVVNVDEGGRPALGFFEVAAVDTMHTYTRNADFPPAFRLSEDHCMYDWSRWPPVNHPECNDCLTLPSSTLQKPVWWQ
jgi:hypothetical protein